MRTADRVARHLVSKYEPCYDNRSLAPPLYATSLSLRASLPTTATFLLSFLFFETKQPTYLSLSLSFYLP